MVPWVGGTRLEERCLPITMNNTRYRDNYRYLSGPWGQNLGEDGGIDRDGERYCRADGDEDMLKEREGDRSCLGEWSAWPLWPPGEEEAGMEREGEQVWRGDRSCRPGPPGDDTGVQPRLMETPDR